MNQVVAERREGGMLEIEPQTPFGVCIEPPRSARTSKQRKKFKVADLDADWLRSWIYEARYAVLRGFAPMERDEFVAYCRAWGEILTWDFGEVLDLSVHETPKNYLFTNGDVPFHWDGAFARAEPRFLVFQCLDAPQAGSGGETTLCDTTRVWDEADPIKRKHWLEIEIRYLTQKVEHYGGDITRPLCQLHPITGKPTLRYAEPLAAESYLNPLELQVQGMSQSEQEQFFQEMRMRLYAPSVFASHEWSKGDFLFVDNHALLHGRLPFQVESSRRIQRIHVI